MELVLGLIYGYIIYRVEGLIDSAEKSRNSEKRQQQIILSISLFIGPIKQH